ncbi:hypothetical protein ANAPC1_01225 [Anaplasma phagocytophilum]|uniref:Uncharacterized protein n=1 Tax=Anaplasma phagocytophilum TaxID=948 RepID=A0AA45UUK0_ANAPH|nr:hypothetical protein ANAPC1_00670 [Anaplasma phagocytophilum]SBO14853.1 hypothetical protein ANAPC1_01225 [Anaplasma phagocytophilum]
MDQVYVILVSTHAYTMTLSKTRITVRVNTAERRAVSSVQLICIYVNQVHIAGIDSIIHYVGTFSSLYYKTSLLTPA